MNNGLQGWPDVREARNMPNLFGARSAIPSRLALYRGRPHLVEADIVATVDAVGSTNMVVNLATNYAIGDQVFVALKCSANNTPGTPAGWSLIQSGAQGSLGNIIITKTMDGTEGTTVTITSAASATFGAISFRVMDQAQVFAVSAGNVGSGSTPNIAGAAFYPHFAYILPCLAMIIGTSTGTIGLNGSGLTGTVPTGIINTWSSNVTTFEKFSEGVQGIHRAWVMWADMPTPQVSGFAALGTWTNFAVVQASMSAKRVPMPVRK